MKCAHKWARCYWMTRKTWLWQAESGFMRLILDCLYVARVLTCSMCGSADLPKNSRQPHLQKVICAITSDLSWDKKVTYKTLWELALSDSNNPAGSQIMIYVLWLESARGSNVCVYGSRAPRRSIGATQREYIWCKIASSVYNSIWSLWERQANTAWYIAPVSRHGRSIHTKIHLSLRSQMIRLICCEHSYF